MLEDAKTGDKPSVKPQKTPTLSAEDIEKKLQVETIQGILSVNKGYLYAGGWEPAEVNGGADSGEAGWEGEEGGGGAGQEGGRAPARPGWGGGVGARGRFRGGNNLSFCTLDHPTKL